ncbi:MAG: GPW/gp25 family protein [Cyclobacteriaceae bacterium]
MLEENSFLGKGWSFPPSFDENSKEVKMLSGTEDIQSSLQILLSTRLGERLMQPRFGCNTDEMVFEIMDTTFKTEMKKRIEVSILLFEPRIDLEKIELTQNELEGKILISVDYIVRVTNTRGNLVYPFYLSEK